MDNNRTQRSEGDVPGKPNDNRGVSESEGEKGQAINWKPLPWQSAFLANNFAVEFHGFAAGKTEVLIMAPVWKGYTLGWARSIIFIGATQCTIDRMLERYIPLGAKFEGHRRRFVFPNGTTINCLSSGQSLISLNGDLALVDDSRKADMSWLSFVQRKFKAVLALGPNL